MFFNVILDVFSYVAINLGYPVYDYSLYVYNNYIVETMYLLYYLIYILFVGG